MISESPPAVSARPRLGGGGDLVFAVLEKTRLPHRPSLAGLLAMTHPGLFTRSSNFTVPLNRRTFMVSFGYNRPF